MSARNLVKPDPARVAAFLRGRFPVKTAECVAAETGVAAETVRQWLKGVARPGFPHLLALIGAYGPEFLSAMFPNAPRWLEAARRAERQRELEAELAALAARLADLKGTNDEAARLEALGAERVRSGDERNRGAAARPGGGRGEARRAAGGEG
jgi:hypothetical protein